MLSACASAISISLSHPCGVQVYNATLTHFPLHPSFHPIPPPSPLLTRPQRHQHQDPPLISSPLRTVRSPTAHSLLVITAPGHLGLVPGVDLASAAPFMEAVLVVAHGIRVTAQLAVAATALWGS